MNFYSNSKNTLPRLIFTGDVHVDAPNNHFRREPVEYILYIITKGQMTLVENDVTYQLNQGDFIVLSPEYTHYGVESNFEVDYIYMHFLWDGIEEINVTGNDEYQTRLLHAKTQEYDTFYIPKYSHISYSKLLIAKQYYDSIREEHSDKTNFYRTNASCIFYQLLIHLQRNCTQSITKGPAVVSKIVEYLDEHLKENLGSDDIEMKFHMNFDHLNRLFKKHTGQTIIRYHNFCRINEAKKMLGSGLYSVSQTSEILGFCNEFYFSRVFKQITGISPSKM